MSACKKCTEHCATGPDMLCDFCRNAESELASARGSAEHRAQLWDAINEYAEACGATPGARIYGNTKRQRAVAEIEALVYPLNQEPEPPAKTT